MSTGSNTSGTPRSNCQYNGTGRDRKDGLQLPEIDKKDLTLLSEKAIGSGSYATVYLYKWQDQRVAVKHLIGTETWKEHEIQLITEGKIQWSMKHDHVIDIYGVCRFPMVSFVMEFAEGGTLSNVLNTYQKDLTYEVQVQWVSQIASGLTYLHVNHCVHRDLKSNNVLIKQPICSPSALLTATLKIADFGVSSENFPQTKETSRKSWASPWQAPEVCLRKAKYSKKSDVWSFGVVTYEILTGKVPKFVRDKAQIPEHFHFNFKTILNCCWKINHKCRPKIVGILNGLESMRLSPDAPIASFLDASATSSRQFSPHNIWLPYHCFDVALTSDSRLLLAAIEHGMIEVNEDGNIEGEWLPPKLSSGERDWVASVAALYDGRVAVSVHRAQLVVLLSRSGGRDNGGSATRVTWTEDRRFDRLQWPPWCLSAHKLVLAVTGDRSDGFQPESFVISAAKTAWKNLFSAQEESPGRRLQLIGIENQQLSPVLKREYDIRSVAVADNVVVTASWDKVKLRGGIEADVLDAHRLMDGDERLWRHELASSDEEYMQGICADSTGGMLYVAVCRRDGNSSRVSALSLANGKELKRVALPFNGPQLRPWRLALRGDGVEQQTSATSSDGAIYRDMAVLSWDSSTEHYRTVTVHQNRDE